MLCLTCERPTECHDCGRCEICCRCMPPCAETNHEEARLVGVPASNRGSSRLPLERPAASTTLGGGRLTTGARV